MRARNQYLEKKKKKIKGESFPRLLKKTNLLLGSQNEEVSLCNRCPWKKSSQIFLHHTGGKRKKKIKYNNTTKRTYNFIANSKYYCKLCIDNVYRNKM